MSKNDLKYRELIKKGDHLLEKSKKVEAIDVYDLAIKINPNEWKAYEHKADAYKTMNNNNSNVIKTYDEFLKINPNEERAYENKGEALKNQGELEKAIKTYDEAIKLNPKFSSKWYIKKGTIFNLMGENQQATDAYNEALKLNKDIDMEYWEIGNIFSQKGKLEKMKAYQDEALMMNPELV